MNLNIKPGTCVESCLKLGDKYLTLVILIPYDFKCHF